MSAGPAAPSRLGVPAGRHGTGPGRDTFVHVLRAEWTKFRTVRGWAIGMAVAAILTVAIGYLTAGGDHTSCQPGPCHFFVPVGPGGEAVTDSFYFVHRPLAGNGSITARVTSLTGELPSPSPSLGRVQAGHGPASGMHRGLVPWSKAGLIIKASTRQGSAYAAVLVTGDHGTRMQYDYTQDIAGPAGRPSATSPRWLRLTRSGDSITGYESPDGTHWTRIGAATLSGLPATVQAGLFATSPADSLTTSQGIVGVSNTGGPTLATGAFDHVGLGGAWPSGPWHGDLIGGANAGYPVAGGGYHQSGGAFRVTGSGDIAPDTNGGAGPGQSIEFALFGTFFGLIAVVVVGAVFITAEYRRGLIRTTLAASPRRGQVLAAKAIVIGAVAFVAGLVAAIVAIPLSTHVSRANGNIIYPASALTEVRLVAGTGALLAAAAILAMAVGAMLRRSAIAVTVVIVVIVLPYLLSVTNLPGDQWLLRLAPAAGFSIQQVIPSYPQVTSVCRPGMGCYPLAPWTGFAVLCAWAAAALGLAFCLLRRRDA
jgi:ABC-type transport system involved in multi-copper enzyme maturation permease subunit